jgi:hypothetical protein
LFFVFMWRLGGKLLDDTRYFILTTVPSPFRMDDHVTMK